MIEESGIAVGLVDRRETEGPTRLEVEESGPDITAEAEAAGVDAGAGADVAAGADEDEELAGSCRPWWAETNAGRAATERTAAVTNFMVEVVVQVKNVVQQEDGAITEKNTTVLA